MRKFDRTLFCATIYYIKNDKMETTKMFEDYLDDACAELVREGAEIVCIKDYRGQVIKKFSKNP